MTITGKNLIGSTHSSRSGVRFQGLGGKVEAMPDFSEASQEEIDMAATRAETAFGEYRNCSSERKIGFLEMIAEKLTAATDEIVPLTQQETELPPARLHGEMQRTIRQIRMFAELLREGSWVCAVIDTAEPDRKPLPKPDIRRWEIPRGPVAVFGASNFPFAFSVAGGDTVSALAAGCPVVYKAHPGHPATSEAVGSILVNAVEACQLPDGLFSLLQGVDNGVSTALVSHPAIQAVGFTGSYAGGRALYDAGAKRPVPIPVYAEMGSINPVFILRGMLEDHAEAVATQLAASNTLAVGQFCTNPGMIVLESSADSDRFLSAFAAAVNSVAPAHMLTDKIESSYLAGIRRFSGVPGVERVEGSDAAGGVAANMFKTTVSNLLRHPVLYEEVFGPSSLHVLAQEPEDLLRVVASMPAQLTASVWGTLDDFRRLRTMFELLQGRVGRVICNGVPTGVEVTPAMVHGGPFPATTSATTSVGTSAIYRFTRAVCYQDYPSELLPPALRNDNPLGILRQVNGKYTREAIPL